MYAVLCYIRLCYNGTLLYFLVVYEEVSEPSGALLLTCINFDPGMDK